MTTLQLLIAEYDHVLQLWNSRASIPTHKPGPYKSPLHKYDKGLCVGVFYAEYDHVLQLWNSRASIPTHKPGP